MCPRCPYPPPWGMWSPGSSAPLPLGQGQHPHTLSPCPQPSWRCTRISSCTRAGSIGTRRWPRGRGRSTRDTGPTQSKSPGRWGVAWGAQRHEESPAAGRRNVLFGGGKVSPSSGQGGKEGAGSDGGEPCRGLILAPGWWPQVTRMCSAQPPQRREVGAGLAALCRQLPSSSPQLNIPACILGADVNTSAWPSGRCRGQEKSGVNTAPCYHSARWGDARSMGCSPRGCPGTPAHCPALPTQVGRRAAA